MEQKERNDTELLKSQVEILTQSVNILMNENKKLNSEIDLLAVHLASSISFLTNNHFLE